MVGAFTPYKIDTEFAALCPTIALLEEDEPVYARYSPPFSLNTSVFKKQYEFPEDNFHF